MIMNYILIGFLFSLGWQLARMIFGMVVVPLQPMFNVLEDCLCAIGKKLSGNNDGISNGNRNKIGF
jgi:hypothetical protein